MPYGLNEDARYTQCAQCAAVWKNRHLLIWQTHCVLTRPPSYKEFGYLKRVLKSSGNFRVRLPRGRSYWRRL